VLKDQPLDDDVDDDDLWIDQTAYPVVLYLSGLVGSCRCLSVVGGACMQVKDLLFVLKDQPLDAPAVAVEEIVDHLIAIVGHLTAGGMMMMMMVVVVLMMRMMVIMMMMMMDAPAVARWGRSSTTSSPSWIHEDDEEEEDDGVMIKGRG
jgi:hypothetical protein